LIGVADLEDESVSAFVAALGDRLSRLARCAGRSALAAAISDHRPDYVLLGARADASDAEAIAAAMRTASLGVMIMWGDTRPHAVIDMPGPFEVERFDRTEGLDMFTLRLRGLMRRCRPVALAGQRSTGGTTLDEAAMTLSYGSATVPLSLEDFRLLGPLFDLPGRVWSREDLLDLAYGAQSANAVRTVDVKLNRTRRRLRAALGHDPIRSVRGEGYILDPGA